MQSVADCRVLDTVVFATHSLDVEVNSQYMQLNDVYFVSLLFFLR